MFGVGVGDVVGALEDMSSKGELRVATDNVHNEFLNMLIAGGVPAMVLFLGFIMMIGHTGVIHRKQSRWVGDALICLSVLIMISALLTQPLRIMEKSTP